MQRIIPAATSTITDSCLNKSIKLIEYVIKSSENQPTGNTINEVSDALIKEQ